MNKEKVLTYTYNCTGLQHNKTDSYHSRQKLILLDPPIKIDGIVYNSLSRFPRTFSPLTPTYLS